MTLQDRLAERTRDAVCDACGRKSFCVTEADYLLSAGLLVLIWCWHQSRLYLQHRPRRPETDGLTGSLRQGALPRAVPTLERPLSPWANGRRWPNRARPRPAQVDPQGTITAHGLTVRFMRDC